MSLIKVLLWPVYRRALEEAARIADAHARHVVTRRLYTDTYLERTLENPIAMETSARAVSRQIRERARKSIKEIFIEFLNTIEACW